MTTISKQYKKSGDTCPTSGKWRQIETGKISWHEQGDIFAYYEKNKTDKYGIPRYNLPIITVHYELLDDA